MFVGVFALAALVMALMDALAGGTALMAAVLAAIVMLIVLGALRGQLKQAAHQTSASNYVREDSFGLDVRYDHFLYETTDRRKIETNDSKN